MKILHATSCSATLNLPQLAVSSSWSILSHHHHACNLLADDGTLVALVSEAPGNGPFHIVAPQARFDGLAPRQSIKWRARQIELAHFAVDLQMVQRWNPQLPPLHPPITSAQLTPYRALATMRSTLYSGSPSVTTRAQQGIQRLCQGVMQADNEMLQQGTIALAGLGPGLTPAGDDFLVGFLMALTKEGNGQEKLSRACRLIANYAAATTTQLSARWLECAGEGHFGEEWHQLVRAINSGIDGQIAQAMTRILNTGATSGADALCGFFVGLDVRQN